MTERTPRSVIAWVIDGIYGRDGHDVAGNILDALTDDDVRQLAELRGFQVWRQGSVRHRSCGCITSDEGFGIVCERHADALEHGPSSPRPSQNVYRLFGSRRREEPT